jgi:hypothetical protein
MCHRLDPRSRIAHLSLFAAIAVTAIACHPVPVAGPPGGGGGGGASGDGEGSGPPSVGAAEDVTAELGPWTLQGLVFTPEALPPTPMRLVRVSPPVPLAKARAQWAKMAKDGKPPKGPKATAAQVLASLLYEQAAADPTKKAEPLAEARAALDALRAASKGDPKNGVDAVTLEMAAALAFSADDAAGAQPFLDEIVQRFPNDKVASNARCQLAFARLRAHQNAEAAAVLAGAEDTAELSYVTAWVKFRQGDAATGASLLAKAAASWDAAYIDPLARDFLVMAARGGVPAKDAASVLASLYPDPKIRFEATYQLSRAYAFAGRPADASDTIELALGTGGDVTADMAAKLKKESAALRTLATGKPPVEKATGDAAAYAHAAKATIDARRQEAQACYEQVLQGQPALAGPLMIHLEIDANGAVTGATSEPPEGDAGIAAVARCTVAKIRAWQFPARSGGGVARLTAGFALAPAPAAPQ